MLTWRLTLTNHVNGSDGRHDVRLSLSWRLGPEGEMEDDGTPGISIACLLADVAWLTKPTAPQGDGMRREERGVTIRMHSSLTWGGSDGDQGITVAVFTGRCPRVPASWNATRRRINDKVTDNDHYSSATRRGGFGRRHCYATDHRRHSPRRAIMAETQQRHLAFPPSFPVCMWQGG
ncbi:BgTH12-07573 [Blumeria graminis f. sp. triticale]|uniref:BgTH12-07573 n=1 Tax=Blumeria graminis f. sp. triticale TaxID=1689686 RepID=A0A9W4DIS0_BLUGR|nr:BgTH12-07573 [Blumeria graminis f. sp. triticale]